MICMCAFINMDFITFGSMFEILNSALTIMFVVICSALPIVITIFMLVKFNHLGSEQMQLKYGELTKDLNLSKGRAIILTPVNFLVRRYLLVLSVIYKTHFVA